MTDLEGYDTAETLSEFASGMLETIKMWENEDSMRGAGDTGTPVSSNGCASEDDGVT